MTVLDLGATLLDPGGRGACRPAGLLDAGQSVFSETLCCNGRFERTRRGYMLNETILKILARRLDTSQMSHSGSVTRSTDVHWV